MRSSPIPTSARSSAVADPAPGDEQSEPGLVARVAAAFNNNGSGVRGDLKAVRRRSCSIPRRADARSPRARLRQAARADAALRAWARAYAPTSQSGTGVSATRPGDELGQTPMRSPDACSTSSGRATCRRTASLAPRRLVAPEFQITNDRRSSATQLHAAHRLDRHGDVKADYAALRPLADDPAALLARSTSCSPRAPSRRRRWRC